MTGVDQGPTSERERERKYRIFGGFETQVVSPMGMTMSSYLDMVGIHVVFV